MEKRYLRIIYFVIIIICLEYKTMLARKLSYDVSCVDLMKFLFNMTEPEEAIMSINKYLFFLSMSIFIVLETAELAAFMEKTIGLIVRIKMRYMYKYCLKIIEKSMKIGIGYYFATLSGVFIYSLRFENPSNYIRFIIDNIFVFLYPLLYMCMIGLLTMLMCRLFTLKLGILITLVNVCLSIFVNKRIFIGNYCFYNRYISGMGIEGLIIIILFALLISVVELGRRKWLDGGINSCLQKNR